MKKAFVIATLITIVAVVVALAENKVPIEIVSDVVGFQYHDTNQIAMAFPTVGSAKEVSAYLTNGNTIADFKLVTNDVVTDKNHEFTKNALLVTSNSQWRLMFKSFNEQGYELKPANILPPFFRLALVIKMTQNGDIIMPRVGNLPEEEKGQEINGIPVPREPK